MKKLFSISLLLIALNINASNDYRLNDDGTMSYIGPCTLHEDYESILYSTRVVVPYTEYPSKELIRALETVDPAKFKMLKVAANLEEYNEDEVNIYEALSGFDDISFDNVFNESFGQLQRLSYGAGGGNGGYMTFEVKSDNSIKMVASTFDGDVLYCDSKYFK